MFPAFHALSSLTLGAALRAGFGPLSNGLIEPAGEALVPGLALLERLRHVGQDRAVVVERLVGIETPLRIATGLQQAPVGRLHLLNDRAFLRREYAAPRQQ